MQLEYRRFDKEKDNYLLKEIEKDEDFKKFFRFDNKTNLVVDNGVVVAGYVISTLYGCPEIQVGVLKEHRRKGYASRIINDLTNSFFEEDIPCTYVLVSKNNLISLETAKKCGYHIDYDKEEFNPYNKEDEYYTLYRRNPNYKNSIKR